MAGTEEHPERIEANQHRGRLIGSEHLGRYRWAAQLAQGRRVLDAGSGTGYGARILIEAGAESVIGVDLSAEAIATAHASHKLAHVDFVQGDLASLELSDDEVDLVTCFETIEHVKEPEEVLSELARVLRPEGVLCISTPNADVYPKGNPYHVFEYDQQGFEEALHRHFAHVRLHPQSAYLASAIIDREERAAMDSAPSAPLSFFPPSESDSSPMTFMLATAGHRPPPSPAPVVVLGDVFEVRWWQDQIDAAAAEAAAARRDAAVAADELKTAREHAAQAGRRVVEVEQACALATASVEALEQTLELRDSERVELESELGSVRQASRAKTDVLERELARARSVMDQMKDSVSWRVTAPLRGAKRLVVKLGGG